MRRIFTQALLASSIAIGLGLGLAGVARAQAEVKIGVIYPLTGPGAAVGAELRSALELAADIINNGAPGIAELPFSAGKGLPNLKGAKIKLVFADHQANPQTGATEAERLARIAGRTTSIDGLPVRLQDRAPH